MSETTNKSGNIGKVLIVAVLIAAVIGVLVLKNRDTGGTKDNDAPPTNTVAAPGPKDGINETPVPVAAEKLPKLVDLGAGKCIPCKMMAPILEELSKEYAGRLEIVFIDVWKDQEAGEPYNIRTIPTQIFYDADGNELFRHEGFYSKDDILLKWAELGVDLEPKP